MLFKIAFRNVFRQKRRTILTGLTILGGFVLSALAIGISDGTYTSVIELFTRSRLGHIQIHAQGYLFLFSGDISSGAAAGDPPGPADDVLHDVAEPEPELLHCPSERGAVEQPVAVPAAGRAIVDAGGGNGRVYDGESDRAFAADVGAGVGGDGQRGGGGDGDSGTVDLDVVMLAAAAAGGVAGGAGRTCRRRAVGPELRGRVERAGAESAGPRD